MLHKVRIIAKGWESFSGNFCATNFIDGVSEHPVPRMVADRIAALVLCELVDEDGEAAGQAGAAARIVQTRMVTAEEIAALGRPTQKELAAEYRAEQDAALINPANHIYTEEQLEEIATNKGINGLRTIGDIWRVKDRSINKLIAEILRAQSEYLAKVEEREAELRRDREAAMQEALDKQAAREAEISATARVLAQSEPNTGVTRFGPGGVVGIATATPMVISEGYPPQFVNTIAQLKAISNALGESAQSEEQTDQGDGNHQTTPADDKAEGAGE